MHGQASQSQARTNADGGRHPVDAEEETEAAGQPEGEEHQKREDHAGYEATNHFLSHLGCEVRDGAVHAITPLPATSAHSEQIRQPQTIQAVQHMPDCPSNQRCTETR